MSKSKKPTNKAKAKKESTAGKQSNIEPLDIRKDSQWITKLLYALVDFDGTKDAGFHKRFKKLKKDAMDLIERCTKQEVEISRFCKDVDLLVWLDNNPGPQNYYHIRHLAKNLPAELGDIIERDAWVRDIIECPRIDEKRLDDLQAQKKSGETLKNRWENSCASEFIENEAADPEVADPGGEIIDAETGGPKERYIYRWRTLQNNKARRSYFDNKGRTEKTHLAHVELECKDNPFFPHAQNSAHPINKVWDYLEHILPASDKSIGLPTGRRGNPLFEWYAPDENFHEYRFRITRAQKLRRELANADYYQKNIRSLDSVEMDLYESYAQELTSIEEHDKQED